MPETPEAGGFEPSSAAHKTAPEVGSPLDFGYFGIMEKKMENTGIEGYMLGYILGLYWENGEEHGNYRLYQMSAELRSSAGPMTSLPGETRAKHDTSLEGIRCHRKKIHIYVYT